MRNPSLPAHPGKKKYEYIYPIGGEQDELTSVLSFRFILSKL
jgi:hypothetical protein